MTRTRRYDHHHHESSRTSPQRQQPPPLVDDDEVDRGGGSDSGSIINNQELLSSSLLPQHRRQQRHFSAAFDSRDDSGGDEGGARGRQRKRTWIPSIRLNLFGSRVGGEKSGGADDNATDGDYINLHHTHSNGFVSSGCGVIADNNGDSAASGGGVDDDASTSASVASRSIELRRQRHMLRVSAASLRTAAGMLRRLGHYLAYLTLFVMLIVVPTVMYKALANKDFENAAYHSALVMVVGTIVISLRLVYLHLSHWHMPDVQKYVVRILWMVPLYSFQSFLSLRFHNHRIYIDTVRDLYEAYVIASFVYYLIELLGGQESLIEILRQKNEPSLGHHSFPMNHFLKEWDLGVDFMLQCKHGVLQYVIVKAMCAICTLIFASLKVYGEGQFVWYVAYPYLVTVQNVSVMYALYCLMMLYHAVYEELQYPINWRPLGKFLCIKGVIFFTWWQGVLIFYLRDIGIIKTIDTSWDSSDVSNALIDYCIVVEMVIFAICHSYSFTYKEYLPRSPTNDDENNNINNGDEDIVLSATAVRAMASEGSQDDGFVTRIVRPPSPSPEQARSTMAVPLLQQQQYHQATSGASLDDDEHATNDQRSSNGSVVTDVVPVSVDSVDYVGTRQRVGSGDADSDRDNRLGGVSPSEVGPPARTTSYRPPERLQQPMDFKSAFWSSTVPKETIKDIRQVVRGTSGGTINNNNSNGPGENQQEDGHVQAAREGDFGEEQSEGQVPPKRSLSSSILETLRVRLPSADSTTSSTTTPKARTRRDEN